MIKDNLEFKKTFLNTQDMYAHWVEISLQNFNHNVSQFKSAYPDQEIYAVLKADAYGHGIDEVGQISEKNNGISGACTFSLSEALRLRGAGFKKPILVLGVIDSSIESAILNDIALTVYSEDIGFKISNVAKYLNLRARVHIKLDTGLSRLGFLVDENIVSVVKKIQGLDGLYVEGIYTHFAESDIDSPEYTLLQIIRFKSALKELELNGVNIQKRHVANTSAALRFLHDPILRDFNMIRIGGGLYGFKKPFIKTFNSLELKPIFSWKSKIIQIKELPKDSYVGYSRTFKTSRKTVAAILPFGYSDGYPRQLSNLGHVFINGQSAPVIGRVAMNATTIDITDLKDVSINSDVLIIGEGLLHPDEIAEKSNTITYDILTSIRAKKIIV